MVLPSVQLVKCSGEHFFSTTISRLKNVLFLMRLKQGKNPQPFKIKHLLRRSYEVNGSLLCHRTLILVKLIRRWSTQRARGERNEVEYGAKSTQTKIESLLALDAFPMDRYICESGLVIRRIRATWKSSRTGLKNPDSSGPRYR